MKALKIFLSVLILSSFSFADSFYSVYGLGLPFYHISSKAAGMGGVGLGVVDKFSLNFMNPAALDVQGFTTIGVESRFDATDHTIDGQSINTRQGNAAGFRFVVPLIKNKFTVMVALQPLISSKYTLSSIYENGLESYTRLVRGDGGLNAGTIGLQYTVFKWLSVGGLANFNFGSYTEEWKTDFSEPNYVDATDKITSHMWGDSYSLSLLVKPVEKVSVGFVYNTKTELTVENSLTLGGGLKQDAVRLNSDYPASLGVGASYAFSKILIAADFYTQQWSEYALTNSTNEKLNDYIRIGAGLEYLDTNDMYTNYFRRISYRIGAYQTQLPFNNNDRDSIKEMFATFGIGFPFQRYGGRVDMAFEVGKRGEAGAGIYEENIYRISASIVGCELWFQRRYK